MSSNACGPTRSEAPPPGVVQPAPSSLKTIEIGDPDSPIVVRYGDEGRNLKILASEVDVFGPVRIKSLVDEAMGIRLSIETDQVVSVTYADQSGQGAKKVRL